MRTDPLSFTTGLHFHPGYPKCSWARLEHAGSAASQALPCPTEAESALEYQFPGICRHSTVVDTCSGGNRAAHFSKFLPSGIFPVSGAGSEKETHEETHISCSWPPFLVEPLLWQPGKATLHPVPQPLLPPRTAQLPPPVPSPALPAQRAGESGRLSCRGGVYAPGPWAL